MSRAAHLRAASSILSDSDSSSSVQVLTSLMRYSLYAVELAEGFRTTACSRVDALAMLLRSAAISRDLCSPFSSVKWLKAAKALRSLSSSSAHRDPQSARQCVGDLLLPGSTTAAKPAFCRPLPQRTPASRSDEAALSF